MSREAEEVLDIKREGDKLMCLVKWKDLPLSKSTYLATYDLPPGLEGYALGFLFGLDWTDGSSGAGSPEKNKDFEILQRYLPPRATGVEK